MALAASPRRKPWMMQKPRAERLKSAQTSSCSLARGRVRRSRDESVLGTLRQRNERQAALPLSYYGDALIPREHRRHAVAQQQAKHGDSAGGGRQILARQLARLQREPQPAFYLGDIVVDLLALRGSVGFQHVQRHHVRHTDLASFCSQTWSCLSTSSVRLGATPALLSSLMPIQAQAPAMMR